jgi:hypothetical protein
MLPSGEFRHPDLTQELPRKSLELIKPADVEPIGLVDLAHHQFRLAGVHELGHAAGGLNLVDVGFVGHCPPGRVGHRGSYGGGSAVRRVVDSTIPVGVFFRTPGREIDQNSDNYGVRGGDPPPEGIPPGTVLETATLHAVPICLLIRRVILRRIRNTA